MDLAVWPARDTEVATYLFEDGLADVYALAHLEEGELKVLGKLQEGQLFLADGLCRHPGLKTRGGGRRGRRSVWGVGRDDFRGPEGN